MDSKDVRILAKKAMAKKNFAKASDLKQDTWTSADAAAWKSFCFAQAGFSKYASKIPSEIIISKDHLEILKGLTSDEKKNTKLEEKLVKETTENKPTEEAPVEEPAPEAPAEETPVEAPVEEVTEEAPVKEAAENNPSEEAPVEEPKKAGRKSKK